MAVNVSFVQAGGYAASVNRRSQGVLLTKGASATAARAGILPFTGAELQVAAQGTPNMQTTTAAGAMMISDAATGAYIFVADTATTLTHAAANGTNARIDLIIARVYDNEAGDATSTTALTLPGTAGTTLVQIITGAVEIVQGTPSGTPAVPALPNARCVILKQVTVRAATTSILNSDLADTGRPGYTASTGGILLARTSADYPASSYNGQFLFDQALGYLLRSNGTSFSKYEAPRVGASCSTTGDAWSTDGAVVSLGNTGGTWTARKDSGGFVTAGSTATPLTIPAGQDGEYLITAQGISTTAMTGLSRCWIQIGGTLPETGEPNSYRANIATGETNWSVTAKADLQGGDTIGVQLALTTGGAKSTTGWLTATRIGP